MHRGSRRTSGYASRRHKELYALLNVWSTRKLAAKPLSALVETKTLMKQSQLPKVMAVMADEGQRFGRMLREPAAREAFGAFMERRKPDFSQL